MKMIMLLVASVAVGSVCAEANYSRTVDWFHQDYAGLTTSEKAWTDTLGTWSHAGGFTNVGVLVSGESPRLKFTPECSPGDVPLTFTPKTTVAANGFTAVDVVMNFLPDDDLPYPTNDVQTAFTLGYADDGPALSFLVYTVGGWVCVSSADLVPQTNVDYVVRMEASFDSAARNNESPSAKRARVRYLVDGHVMTNAVGVQWFDCYQSGWSRIHGLSLLGFDGEVGEVRAECKRAARASVAIPVARAKTGTSFSGTVVTNESSKLSGDINWRWYAGSWRGEYDDAPLSTGASVKPTSANYARWIKGEAYDDSGYVGEGRFWYSKLPVLYITTDDGAMPDRKKTAKTGHMTIQGTDQYKDSYDGAIEIKTRGNTTRGLPKAPYKIKLDKKTNLFNLGQEKNKHWVLLANYLDESLMRNKMAYDFSALFGIVSMHSTWVDVIMNGAYLGTYQLCEHIRIASDRINIYDWDTAGEDAADAIADGAGLAKAAKKELETQMTTNFAWVTSGKVTYGENTYNVADYWEDYSDRIDGGYIFESSHEYDELSQFRVSEVVGTKTNMLCNVMFNSPEYLYTNPTMMDWCSNYWARTVGAWRSQGGDYGVNAQGEHFSELCDVPSMAGYWWTLVALMNNDAVYKSRYCWMDRGGKINFGPVWDFDYGVGGVPVRGDPISKDPVTGRCVLRPAGTSGWAGGMSSHVECWQCEWVCDPRFCAAVYENYLASRDYYANLFAEGGLIDQYCDYIRESAMANEEKWFYRIGWSGADGDVAALKTFLKGRFAWLEAKMTSLEAFIKSVNATCTSSLGKPFDYDKDFPQPDPENPPSVDVPVSWYDEHFPAFRQKYGAMLPADAARLADAQDEQGLSPSGKAHYTFANDYVAGTEPTNLTQYFSVKIEMVDGLPKISWDPDLHAARRYEVFGKTNLVEDESWSVTNAATRFYKVGVSMPK